MNKLHSHNNILSIVKPFFNLSTKEMLDIILSFYEILGLLMIIYEPSHYLEELINLYHNGHYVCLCNINPR